MEDKVVQRTSAEILEAIYEEDFLSSSHGYRPGRGAKDAVREVTRAIQFGRYRWVVEADIKEFLDGSSYCTFVHGVVGKSCGCWSKKWTQKFGPVGKLDFSGSARGETKQSDEQNKTKTVYRSLQSESWPGSFDGHQNGRPNRPGVPGPPGASHAMEGDDPRSPSGVVRKRSARQR
jgi:hypothetical protein